MWFQWENGLHVYSFVPLYRYITRLCTSFLKDQSFILHLWGNVDYYVDKEKRQTKKMITEMSCKTYQRDQGPRIQELLEQVECRDGKMFFGNGKKKTLKLWQQLYFKKQQVLQVNISFWVVLAVSSLLRFIGYWGLQMTAALWDSLRKSKMKPLFFLCNCLPLSTI